MPCETAHSAPPSAFEDPPAASPVEHDPVPPAAHIEAPPPSQVPDGYVGGFMDYAILLMAILILVAIAAAVGRAIWAGLNRATASLRSEKTAGAARHAMDQQSASYLQSVTRLLFGR